MARTDKNETFYFVEIQDPLSSRQVSAQKKISRCVLRGDGWGRRNQCRVHRAAASPLNHFIKQHWKHHLNRLTLTHMLHEWKRILSTQITAIKRWSQNHPGRGWKLAIINQRLVWDKIQTMSESYWCPSHDVTAAAAYCSELPSALWRASLQQFVLVSWTTASLVGLFSSISSCLWQVLSYSSTWYNKPPDRPLHPDRTGLFRLCTVFVRDLRRIHISSPQLGCALPMQTDYWHQNLHE